MDPFVRNQQESNIVPHLPQTNRPVLNLQHQLSGLLEGERPSWAERQVRKAVQTLKKTVSLIFCVIGIITIMILFRSYLAFVIRVGDASHDWAIKLFY